MGIDIACGMSVRWRRVKERGDVEGGNSVGREEGVHRK